LDPTTGAIKHYTSTDGLVSSSHWGSAFRDHDGNLWFGTLQGLSRLSPKPDASTSPPPVRIDAIRVRGESYPVSEVGETRLVNLVLPPDQNQIEIDFASFNFATGDSPRYQYKLEGADRDWSRVSDQRAVNYATLSPGTYRFLVRAVDSKGWVSSQPAEMQFRVVPPLWQRWWFLGCLAVLAALMVYAIYRSRLSQLLELERVRTRIATDLHDDIGSSLTQISILSEVLRQNAGQDGQAGGEHLARIANLSRELVDSMSDIVWAVNPRRDNLGDLNHRMRRFASDVLDARGIEFDFHAPKAHENKQLRTDTRRQVFLVFKEGINNVVRHSECRHVTIELAINRNQLWLKLADDGKGLDAGHMTGDGNRTHGHGLFSIAQRAKSLGGEFIVDSNPGQGTVLTLRVPL
jgi:signal transduction histidine kinase